MNVTVYDDRLEVESSGFLTSGLSPEKVSNRTNACRPNPRNARAWVQF